MTKKEQAKFSKNQIVNSKLFENYIDFLNGILSNDEMYTKDEVYKLIRNNYEVK